MSKRDALRGHTPIGGRASPRAARPTFHLSPFTFYLSLASLALLLCASVSAAEVPPDRQSPRGTVSGMKDLALPAAAHYAYKDWRQTTVDYINYVLNANNTFEGADARGNLVTSPIGRFTPSRDMDIYFRDAGSTAWGIPSYIGRVSEDASAGEGINVIAAILSASMVGLDMTRYSVDGGVTHRNYVRGLVHYYNVGNGEKVVLNGAGQRTGQTFWYEILPNCLFNSICAYYPEEAYLKDIAVTSARQWMRVVDALGGPRADFGGITSFSLARGEKAYNGKWVEPDGAAGIAYLLYGAYHITKDDPELKTLSGQFLERAMWCMNYLDARDDSPFYEVLTFLAVPVAARMNAESGTRYDIAKMINFTLRSHASVRGGWGMITDNWGGTYTGGLMGSTTDNGGYAFAMNTFDAAWGYLPAAKYATRYAYDIGRWMLAASNSARLFYPESLPFTGTTRTDTVGGVDYRHWDGDFQSGNWIPGAADSRASFIPYEGLRAYKRGFNYVAGGGGVTKQNVNDTAKAPYASGDAFTYDWGGLTDYGLYGASHVGMFGAAIRKTNVERILQVDLNAADFFKAPGAFPTYLYFNPHHSAQTVRYAKAAAENRLYNAVTKDFIAVGGAGANITVNVPADDVVIVVELPATGAVTLSGGSYLCNGIFVTSAP
ncbi:MAG: hypothetical protein FWG50_06025 [Kiritimatiellaeota bacterium]|nr:hypothetical protein [Kiritimatiellota bacterium]